MSRPRPSRRASRNRFRPTRVRAWCAPPLRAAFAPTSPARRLAFAPEACPQPSPPRGRRARRPRVNDPRRRARARRDPRPRDTARSRSPREISAPGPRRGRVTRKRGGIHRAPTPRRGAAPTRHVPCLRERTRHDARRTRARAPRGRPRKARSILAEVAEDRPTRVASRDPRTVAEGADPSPGEAGEGGGATHRRRRRAPIVPTVGETDAAGSRRGDGAPS